MPWDLVGVCLPLPQQEKGRERPGSQLYLMLLRLAFEIKGSTVCQQVVKNFWWGWSPTLSAGLHILVHLTTPRIDM